MLIEPRSFFFLSNQTLQKYITRKDTFFHNHNSLSSFFYFIQDDFLSLVYTYRKNFTLDIIRSKEILTGDRVVQLAKIWKNSVHSKLSRAESKWVELSRVESSRAKLSQAKSSCVQFYPAIPYCTFFPSISLRWFDRRHQDII